MKIWSHMKIRCQCPRMLLVRYLFKSVDFPAIVPFASSYNIRAKIDSFLGQKTNNISSQTVTVCKGASAAISVSSAMEH